VLAPFRDDLLIGAPDVIHPFPDGIFVRCPGRSGGANSGGARVAKGTRLTFVHHDGVQPAA
jgi:hypothetical protein